MKPCLFGPLFVRWRKMKKKIKKMNRPLLDLPASPQVKIILIFQFCFVGVTQRFHSLGYMKCCLIRNLVRVDWVFTAIGKLLATRLQQPPQQQPALPVFLSNNGTYAVIQWGGGGSDEQCFTHAVCSVHLSSRAGQREREREGGREDLARAKPGQGNKKERRATAAAAPCIEQRYPSLTDRRKGDYVRTLRSRWCWCCMQGSSTLQCCHHPHIQHILYSLHGSGLD